MTTTERVDGWDCYEDQSGTRIATPADPPDGLLARAEARLTVAGELLVAAEGEGRVSPRVVEWLTDDPHRLAELRRAIEAIRLVWLSCGPSDALTAALDAVPCPECYQIDWSHKLDCSQALPELVAKSLRELGE